MNLIYIKNQMIGAYKLLSTLAKDELIDASDKIILSDVMITLADASFSLSTHEEQGNHIVDSLFQSINEVIEALNQFYIYHSVDEPIRVHSTPAALLLSELKVSILEAKLAVKAERIEGLESELADKIEELENVQDDKESVIYLLENNLLYKISEGKRVGPFCYTCFTDYEDIVKLGKEDEYTWVCDECDSTVYSYNNNQLDLMCFK
ncbi:hypothetical protein [Vibrio sp. EJY3]|uniref:hypothetical protein n=1 Tax=Vibrio sp. (strain EJY3) TaxID=1116375 RepID=UPI000243BA15|nr:hypothetical protein [Vibrio sp. EJY3]AEX21527.1 hypothetical protein VEJY3_05155 [Vibrio sp. EJY3]